MSASARVAWRHIGATGEDLLAEVRGRYTVRVWSWGGPPRPGWRWSVREGPYGVAYAAGEAPTREAAQEAALASLPLSTWRTDS